MRRAVRTIVAIVVFMGLASGPLAVLAGSFQVNPIRLDLSAGTTSAALSVRNTGNESVVVQVSIEAWSQEDGKDIYAPTREVLVTPPVVTIPAGAERIIRAGLRRAPDREKELSYRLFLQEVPPPPQPGFQGLLVALRIGLPVFVQPVQGKAEPRMEWQARRLPGNQVEIRAANTGSAHLQIAELNVFANAAEPAGSAPQYVANSCADALRPMTRDPFTSTCVPAGIVNVRVLSLAVLSCTSL